MHYDQAVLARWRKKILRGKICRILFCVIFIILFALSVFVSWSNAIDARTAFAIFMDRFIYAVARFFVAKPGCYMEFFVVLYTICFFSLAIVVLGVSIFGAWKLRFFRINRRLMRVFPYRSGRYMTLRSKRWDANRLFGMVYIVNSYGRASCEFEERAKGRLKVAIRAATIHDIVEVNDTIQICFTPSKCQSKQLNDVISRTRYF